MSREPKTPTKTSPRRPNANELYALLASVVVSTAPNLAEAQLTVEQCISRALGRPQQAAISSSNVERELAGHRGRASVPNPQIGYERETVTEGSNEAEEIFSISQRIDLGGRRFALRNARQDHRRAAELENETRLLALRLRTRHAFYQTLAAQQRLVALIDFERQTRDAMTIVERRHGAGETSQYALLRMRRQLHLVQALVSQERGDAERAWAQLSALIGPGQEAAQNDWPRVRGALLPSGPEGTGLARPDIEALATRGEAFANEERAARRSGAPSLQLEAGFRRVNERSGYALRAGLTVPIASRGQFARDAARAAENGVRAEHSLLTERAEIESNITLRELAIRRAAAAQFGAYVEEHSARLLTTAQAAFEGDELSLVGYLDAQQSVLSDRLRAIDLRLAARSAEIRLQTVTGQVEASP